jgi:hypothetical protein
MGICPANGSIIIGILLLLGGAGFIFEAIRSGKKDLIIGGILGIVIGIALISCGT